MNECWALLAHGLWPSLDANYKSLPVSFSIGQPKPLFLYFASTHEVTHALFLYFEFIVPTHAPVFVNPSPQTHLSIYLNPIFLVFEFLFICVINNEKKCSINVFYGMSVYMQKKLFITSIGNCFPRNYGKVRVYFLHFSLLKSRSPNMKFILERKPFPQSLLFLQRIAKQICRMKIVFMDFHLCFSMENQF